MSLAARLIEMEVERQAELRLQIQMLGSGNLRMWEGNVEVTEQSLERCKCQLAESEEILPLLGEKASNWC